MYFLIALLTIFTSNDIIILTITPFICFFCKNDKINPLTGQVINEDKTASTTNIQTYGLTVLNQKDTLKELLGPRADDPVSKADMMSQIENSGVYRMDNSVILTENKQAINTAETFAKAAGIDIKFKRNNLSNSQQQFTQEELSEIFSEEIEDEE